MQEVLSYLLENIYTISWSIITAMVVTAVALVSIGSLESEIDRRRKAEGELKEKIDELNVAKDYLSKQEQYLHAVLSSMGEGLVVCDKECKVRLINQFGASLLRHPPNEAVGRRLDELSEFFLEKETEKNISLLPTTMIGKIIDEPDIVTVTPTDHLYCRNAHGVVFPVVMVVAPLIQVMEEKSVILLFRDGSRESEIDKAKTEFVSIASHQLRTPLSTINWYTELLLGGDGGKITKQQKEMLEEIDHGTRRMTELVDSLLDISRIEMGTFMIQPEMASWAEIVDDVIDEVKPRILNKKMKLKFVGKEVWPQIPTDKKLFRIAVQNLITNAIKYSPDGGDIKINFEFGNGLATLTVSDSGYGIPKEEQNKIFTKMFRASNVLTKSVDGNGLGLYIVKSIVEQGGGKIWFDSSENQGTSFHIQFPISGMVAKEGTKELV